MQNLTIRNFSFSFLTISLVLVMGLLVGGCADIQLSSSDSSDSDVRVQGLTPEQLGTLGAKLNQNLGDHSVLLDEYNVTTSQFETAVNTISNDSALSRRYRDAYEEQFYS